jgi:hypothetical protein
MEDTMAQTLRPSVFALFLIALVSLPLMAWAESEQAPIPDSQSQIMKFSDKGISPEVLHMKKEDSILFFLNQTKDSLTTLELDYGNHHTHCSSTNLKIGDDGVVRSVRPFGPRDFASVCFHDKGTYKLKVYGLNKNPLGSTATVVVE